MIEVDKTVGGLDVPNGWHVIQTLSDDDGIHSKAYERLFGGKLYVIETIAPHDDGKQWLHVSLSKPNNKMLSYDEVAGMRKLFIGEDRECYMIFPPKERYVNINPNVLHLYCCLDAPSGVLPPMEGEINGVLSI